MSVAQPGRPQDLEGEASAKGIALTWNAPADSADTRDMVYRAELDISRVPGRPLSKFATIEATGPDMAYTDTNSMPGVDQRYRVAAVNYAGGYKKSNSFNIVT